MTKTTGNHDAFPATEYYDEKPIGGSDGLSKREYFAAIALQGLLANPNYAAVENFQNGGIAQIAVLQADALIDALNVEYDD